MIFTRRKSDKTATAAFAPNVWQLFSFTFFVFLTSGAILIFTAGCPPVKLPVEELNKVEPNDIESVTVQPEPNVIEPEPNITEPNVTEPNVVEPNVSGPNVAKADAAESNDIESAPKVAFHDKCADIFSSFVDDKGMVKYRLLDHRKELLGIVLDEFARLPRSKYDSWPEEDKMAFWINACNMQMLRVIIDNYPIESKRFYRLIWPPTSIRHIEPTDVFGVAKWDKYKFTVMDEEFKLSEIDKRFFRKQFGEPRVFFALTHAALSGPPLRNEPYYGYKLRRQLDDQVKRFLSNPKAFRIDRKRREVYLSAMFEPKWYGKEFINKYGTNKKFKDQRTATRAVLNFITNYISEQDAFFLEKENYSVRFIGYDWRLNDGSQKP